MGATVLSELDGLLKRNYGPDFIQDQQQFDPDFLSVLRKGTEKPGGEDGAFRFGVRMQRRQNGGAQNQNEQFRSNETGVRKQATVAAKINIWAIELTNFAAALARGAKTSFASALDDEMSDALSAMKKDMNRQCFGPGTGQLALVNGAVAASASVIVDTPGTQYFYAGMRIDIYTAAGVAEALNQKISSVDHDNLTLTLENAVTVSNNSVIYRAGVYNTADANATPKEMMGLQGIADDGTLATSFQGLSRSTYDIWKGTVINANSAVLTTDLVQRLADKVEFRSGKKVDRLVSHRNQRRQYLSLVTPLKRFMSDKLDAGFAVLEWNGIPWMVSHDCQKDTIYAYNNQAVENYEVLPIKLDDSGGSTVTRIPGTDTIESYYKHYGNNGSKQPAATGRVHTLATLSE